MPKVLCIVGPTGVGKTALSVLLAPLISGVILSADSVQAYQTLDIISGKDKEVLQIVPHFLLDVVPPTYSFHVSDYLQEFQKALELIPQGKVPIIVGGTGFYISALINGIETAGIVPDINLRLLLEKLTVQELQNILKSKNLDKFQHMNHSDKNNPRRLVRAIEVGKNINPDLIGVKNQESILDGYDVQIVGLTMPREALNARIDARVDERMKSGALKEAQGLFGKYVRLAPQIQRANGYKQLFDYLMGNMTLEEAIMNWKIAEHQNAKKQITYFKKMKNIHWYNLEKTSFDKIFKYIEQWYNNK